MVGFLNEADMPPTAATCSGLSMLNTYSDMGMYLPPARGLVLGLDLYDNAQASSNGIDVGLGYKAIALPTSSSFVELVTNISTGTVRAPGCPHARRGNPGSDCAPGRRWRPPPRSRRRASR